MRRLSADSFYLLDNQLHCSGHGAVLGVKENLQLSGPQIARIEPRRGPVDETFGSAQTSGDP